MGSGISVREGFFADDVGLVTIRPKEHQLLLNACDNFLTWTNSMAAKPSKCKSLAYKQFKPGAVHKYSPFEDLVYSAYDPLLTVSGEPVGFIADQPFKYLGRQIYATLNTPCSERKRLSA